MNTNFISHEDFVRIWQAANSAEEARDAMGLSYSGCTQRATQLRKRGVRLKKFAPGRGPGVSEVDVERLNRLCVEGQ